MKKYRLEIFGRNFLMENEGRREKLGFRATCLAESVNADKAKEMGHAKRETEAVITFEFFPETEHLIADALDLDLDDI